MKRFIFAVLLVFAVSISDYYRPVATSVEAKEADLIVHEWGTFTTIAGKNGVALDWRPLNGPSDLPSFVYTEGENGFRGTHRSGGKGEIARVRMETPVIYFYTPKEMDVSVRVTFPEGKITEWYPQAGFVNNMFGPNQTGRTFANGINWGTVKLLPNHPENYLREAADSHYYPARETDSVPIQVCNADKTRIEHEKFLFYRGTGNFDLPLKAVLENKEVVLTASNAQYLAKKGAPDQGLVDMVVFEKRGNKMGYKYIPQLLGETRVERPALDKTLEQVYSQLKKSLTAHGLYEKEADAMIKTWSDSWFEEGLRVFYFVPRTVTDRILPLTVSPKPKETVRVMIGRMELITPEMEKEVRNQVGRLRSRSAKARAAATEELKKHGRFYEPILRSLLVDEKDAAVRKMLEKLIAEA